MTRSLTMRAIATAMALLVSAAPAAAQVRTVDPNSAIDADLSPPPARGNTYYDDTAPPPPPAASSDADADLIGTDGGADIPAAPPPPPVATQAPPAATSPVQSPAAPSATNQALREQATTQTYKRDDLIAAAENVFGKGAEGLAGLLENILRDQGEPNGYIAGREASAAFVVGLRYGSGTLFHAVEGQRPAYWTGPSVGFDVGGNAAQTFVLVYNLYDTQDLYKRFPAGEGNAYLLGGFTASYLRRGDVVLIPIRLGVGWRLGVNAGYMRFTERQNWVPF